MSILKLDHSLTPSELAELNQRINKIFDEEEVDTKCLLNFINQREQFVLDFVSSLPSDCSELTDFVNMELDVNKRLLTEVSKYHKDSEGKLKKLIKGRKALKKYA